MLRFVLRVVARVAALAATGALAAPADPAGSSPGPGAPPAVTLAPVFSDGAVLQRDRPLPIWGRVAAGTSAKVAVDFAGQRREATPDPDGRWLVLLDPLPASAVGRELVVTGPGGRPLVLRDVLVGEVWLCAGGELLERAAPAGSSAAALPAVRRLPLARPPAAPSGWQSAVPPHAAAFPAVGLRFARELHTKLGVPIGLVDAAVAGAAPASWLSAAAFARVPALQALDERWARTVADYPARRSAYEAAAAAWTAAEAAARARSRADLEHFLRTRPRPVPPAGPGHPATPRGLYHGTVDPLAPAALRGVLWDAGDGGDVAPAEFLPLLRTLVETWRDHFGQPDLAFFWVGLPALRLPADPTGRHAALIREAQTRALDLPHTGQAPSVDLGPLEAGFATAADELGRRLALLARHRLFGFVGDDSGPVFAGALREGATLRVRFRHVGSGLFAQDRPVQSLELAGPDRIFHPASGRLDHDTLVVASPLVREPVAVRYAWTNAPVANLRNGAGLPALPFRSDDW